MYKVLVDPRNFESFYLNPLDETFVYTRDQCFILRMLGWHWSIVARNRLRTKFPPQAQAGEPPHDRRLHRIVQQLCWKFPISCQLNGIIDPEFFQTHIALSTWLDPDESIRKSTSSVGCWAKTKASTLDVAPVSPCNLTSWLLSTAASIRNEVGGEASSCQKRGKCIDVSDFVTVGVALSV